ncbi:MAG: hypothetical protein WA414_08960, partial [Acidobacteriaceae bacterium]
MDRVLQVEAMEPVFSAPANIRDNPGPPWENRPYDLLTWWEMERFGAVEFYSIGAQLSALVSSAEVDQEEGKRIPIHPDALQTFARVTSKIVAACQKLGLQVSVKAAVSLLTLLAQPN